MEEIFSVIRGGVVPLCIFCFIITVITGFEAGNFLGKLFAKETLNRFEEKRLRLYAQIALICSVIFIVLLIYAALYDKASWGKAVFLPLGAHIGITVLFILISSRKVT